MTLNSLIGKSFNFINDNGYGHVFHLTHVINKVSSDPIVHTENDIEEPGTTYTYYQFTYDYDRIGEYRIYDNGQSELVFFDGWDNRIDYKL